MNEIETSCCQVLYSSIVHTREKLAKKNGTGLRADIWNTNNCDSFDCNAKLCRFCERDNEHIEVTNGIILAKIDILLWGTFHVAADNSIKFVDAFKWLHSKFFFINCGEFNWDCPLTQFQAFISRSFGFNSWMHQQPLTHTLVQTRTWASFPPGGDKETLSCHFGFQLPPTPLQQTLGWAGVIGATYDPVKSEGR